MTYCSLWKNLFLPVRDFTRGTEISKCLKSLEKTQWLSSKEIIELQNKRLRALINHVYTNVPFYHRMFRIRGLKPDNIRTTEDLTKLPILTRESVRKNFHDMIARNIPRNEMRPYYTGGSTGEPLHFYITKASRNWGVAAELRAYSWAGYHLGDKLALVWGSLSDLSNYKKLSSNIQNLVSRCVVLNCHEFTAEHLDKFIKKMNSFKPSYIRGYASAIYLLAEYIKNREVNFHPKAVITCAEKLFNYQRESIEKNIACDVYDFYGSREVPAMAAECSDHSGYHVSSENVFIEFVKQGKLVSEGEMGEILVTNFHNYAFPLIRYRNGDAGTPLHELCKCGRGLPLMSSIEGRVTDIILTRKGRYISTPVLTLIFNDKNIEQYQIIQESLDEVTVKLVTTKDLEQEARNNIILKMKYYLGEETAIDIEMVDSIPLPTSGKRRVAISKVSHKYFE